MSVWAIGFEPGGDRRDSTPSCTPGNKPCGKRCIPQNQNCGRGLKKAATVAAVAGGVTAAVLGGRAIVRRARAARAEAVQQGVQNLEDFLKEQETRSPSPYRGGKSIDYWSPNAETNDLRRAGAGLGWAANDINNTERRSQGLMSLNPGYRTTPGRSNRRPRPMKRKS